MQVIFTIGLGLDALVVAIVDRFITEKLFSDSGATQRPTGAAVLRDPPEAGQLQRVPQNKKKRIPLGLQQGTRAARQEARPAS